MELTEEETPIEKVEKLIRDKLLANVKIKKAYLIKNQTQPEMIEAEVESWSKKQEIMTDKMEQIKLFGDDFKKIIQDGVQFLQMDTTNMKETTVEKHTWATNNASSLTCSYCRVEFADTVQQREHYKLDWHRYNLKQSLLLRQPLTEEEFNEKTDDISSISGSDSEKEDSLENVAVAQGKLFLKNNQGMVFTMYRCLLFEKKDELEDGLLLKQLRACSANPQWTVLMLGGGHFAGGIFQGSDPVLHKTFHCYTVRAGQGGSQGARDNRSGGSQPKSAGASLRRYNETALVQHVRDIIEVWKDEIAKSSLIVYRAAGPYNRSVLFGGKTPPLNRSDPRLKTIPFSTRRATFTELKRVHNLLTTVYVYESVEKAIQQLPKQEPLEHQNRRSKSKITNINRAKSREEVERALPANCLTSSSSGDDSDVDDLQQQLELSTNEQEISFQDCLQSFGDSLTPEQRKRAPRKPKKPHKSKNRKLKEREALRKKQTYEIVSSGDVGKLEALLKEFVLTHKEGELINNDSEGKVELQLSAESEKPNINEVLDEKGNTLLHVAAMHEQLVIVRLLLDYDANPCAKNDKQYTPYTCTPNKDVRKIFKDFAQEFPEKYNYNKAQIPLPVVSTEEQAEKKRMLRITKREKEKEKKKQNAIKKQEETNKERFLNLSDREKRALAAERRILSQSGTVISRCFLCAADISGQVPFEYSGNRFCSIDCLKAHRLSNPATMSK